MKLATLTNLTIGLTVSVSALAQSENFPNRPIKIVLPLSAGSGGDTIGRTVADEMASKLNGTAFADNKVGAGGTIGATQVARAPADGYTVMLGGMTSHIIAPAVYAKLPYDPVNDFTQIGRIGTAGVVIVSTLSFGAKNLSELISISKQSKVPQQYATWGHGSTGHLCGEVLNQMAGANLEHVPFKSSGDLVTGLLGGHIQLAVLDMGTATPLVQTGKIKALGICGGRSPSLPNIGTYPEQGINFKSELSWMLLGPKGIPLPILNKLTQALKDSLDDKSVANRLIGLGVQPAYLPPDQLKKLMTEDVETWKGVAKAARVQPN